MSVGQCCVTGFTWDGTPTGRTSKIAQNDAYVTGDNPDAAVLFISDLFGWTFNNIRLLADHYAKEAGVTVYVADFFGGEVINAEPLINGRWQEIDLEGFVGRNSREIREPEIFDCARALRQNYKKVGAVGFCYGGWACFRLAAKEHQPPLVDCISVGHPSMLTAKDIDEAGQIPVQLLAPEYDQMYTAELKLHTFQTLQKLNVPFDYQHFPGVEHACFIRGDDRKEGELKAMVRGKNAAVAWFKQHLFLD
ncbi:dienelactone hydrolase family protein [Seiridium cupressi]